MENLLYLAGYSALLPTFMCECMTVKTRICFSQLSNLIAAVTVMTVTYVHSTHIFDVHIIYLYIHRVRVRVQEAGENNMMYILL